MDFYLVKALVYEESWFRADIRGAAGELGLMQVTMGAAADFSSYNGFPPVSEARLLEPRLNVEIGCWYLKQSLERYKNSPAPTLFALLRYNAGETRADQWLRLARANPVPAGMVRNNTTCRSWISLQPANMCAASCGVPAAAITGFKQAVTEYEHTYSATAAGLLPS